MRPEYHTEPPAIFHLRRPLHQRKLFPMKRSTARPAAVTLPQTRLDELLAQAARLQSEMGELLAELEQAANYNGPTGSWRHHPPQIAESIKPNGTDQTPPNSSPERPR